VVGRYLFLDTYDLGFRISDFEFWIRVMRCSSDTCDWNYSKPCQAYLPTSVNCFRTFLVLNIFLQTNSKVPVLHTPVFIPQSPNDQPSPLSSLPPCPAPHPALSPAVFCPRRCPAHTRSLGPGQPHLPRLLCVSREMHIELSASPRVSSSRYKRAGRA
jgi:hypothetical protein